MLPTGLILIALVRRDYQRRGRLARGTVAAVWLLYVAHFALVVATGWFTVFPLPLPVWIGWGLGAPLLVMGSGLAGAGVIAFRSFDLMSGRTADELVTSGVYRLSRNPQNVGWGLATLGIALMGGSGLALIQVAVFWVLFSAYVPVEESYLESAYGTAYRRYTAEVPRIIGFPREPKPLGGYSGD